MASVEGFLFGVAGWYSTCTILVVSLDCRQPVSENVNEGHQLRLWLFGVYDVTVFSPDEPITEETSPVPSDDVERVSEMTGWIGKWSTGNGFLVFELFRFILGTSSSLL